MLATLDVSLFRTSYTYQGVGHQLELSDTTAAAMQRVVENLMVLEQVIHNFSLGFSVAVPVVSQRETELHGHGYEDDWNEPYSLTAFVGGWGPDRDMYIANAVRKMRAAARTDRDTLDIKLEIPTLFEDPVDSQNDDGTFSWGDFPHGGAVHVRVGNHQLLGAVSGLEEEEDHAIATFMLSLMGAQMLRGGNPPI